MIIKIQHLQATPVVQSKASFSTQESISDSENSSVSDQVCVVRFTVQPTALLHISFEDCSVTELTGIIYVLKNNKASNIPININKKSAPIIVSILIETLDHCNCRKI